MTFSGKGSYKGGNNGPLCSKNCHFTLVSRVFLLIELFSMIFISSFSVDWFITGVEMLQSLDDNWEILWVKFEKHAEQHFCNFKMSSDMPEI